MELTITEALQEVKTSKARIEKKRAAIGQYLARDARVKDPLEVEGGSIKYIREERQAILDLEERIIRLRGAIQKKNADSVLILHGKTRTIMDWMNWRRDVSEGQKSFVNGLVQSVKAVRTQAQQKGLSIVETEPTGPAASIIVAVPEIELLSEAEKIEQLLGDLDGKLSLLNATLTVDVA